MPINNAKVDLVHQIEKFKALKRRQILTKKVRNVLYGLTVGCLTYYLWLKGLESIAIGIITTLIYLRKTNNG